MSRAMAAGQILFGIFLVAIASTGTAQTEDGLLGIPWGTRVDQLRERFALDASDSDSVSVHYASNIARVGGVDVEECFLEFSKGRFAGAGTLTRGPHNTHRLLAYLTRVFGPGNEESARAYQWMTGNTHVYYDEDSEGDGYIYWYSRKLFNAEISRRFPAREHAPRQPDNR